MLDDVRATNLDAVWPREKMMMTMMMKLSALAWHCVGWII